MKIRSCLVSNSSSASYVVKWCINANESYSVKKAVDMLLSYARDSVIQDIVSNTIKIDDNTFLSSFYTCMMNSLDDFGNGAALLMFALSCGDKIHSYLSSASVKILDIDIAHAND